METPEYDYILRTCASNLTSHSHDGAFQWPEKGPVEAPDWDPTPKCGGGLHGFLNGVGSGSFADLIPDVKWLVVRIQKGEYVKVDFGMVKFPRGEVIFCGSQFDATKFIAQFAPEGTAIIGRTCEDKIAVVGDRGTAAAGEYGTAVAGDFGKAAAGKHGTAIAGYGGTTTAGKYGTTSAGFLGTASAGDRGTASAGRYGTASAGEKGIIEIKYFDRGRDRIRKKIGYIGEDGLRPGVKYELDKDHNFVEAE